MGGKANLRSPEVILRFRHKFITFEEHASRALQSIHHDVGSMANWLKGEQLRHWRMELRRRHEHAQNTWREYVNARYEIPRGGGKPSCVDERKAWELAKRRKAEAQAKVEKIQGWAATLEREAERLMPACHRFETALGTLAPKAIARLDHMLDHLEEYLRPVAPPKSE